MNLSATNPPLTPSRRGTDRRALLPSWEGLGGGFTVPMDRQKRRESGRGLPHSKFEIADLTSLLACYVQYSSSKQWRS